ncbi:sex-regulated protein janus-B [Drosophila miranda]|uniref:sex-regulated protein janus-B n=1 Tax=Drosophila miranda TaxID=7229 RepID=UPI0007E6E76E|nr:sex-regulated protein janus-B [Drosophila miranda]
MKILNYFSSIGQCAKPILRTYTSPAADLLKLPRVDIKEGKLRYLLLSVYIHGETKNARTVVRGWNTDSHDDIYYKNVRAMEKLGLCTKCLGGGKMDNDESSRKIKIHGSCKTFGAANHHKTKEILLSSSKYKNFNITVKK